jgi:hypothetical protein
LISGSTTTTTTYLNDLPAWGRGIAYGF